MTKYEAGYWYVKDWNGGREVHIVRVDTDQSVWITGTDEISETNEFEFLGRVPAHKSEEKGSIHIESLFTAFQKFQNAQRLGISSIREPNKWQAEMDKATEEFKKAIGPLANHIDWSK